MPSTNRRQYSKVSSLEDLGNRPTTSSIEESTEQEEDHAEEQADLLTEATETDEDDSLLTVVILDYTQKKFLVKLPSHADVALLKEEGSKVHKVPADRQRLIFRGKLLQDSDSLVDSGICEDDLIVHLFPKPRVVIKEANSSDDGNESSVNSSNANAHLSDEEEGARVPTIFLDAEEAERRSSILVLGSTHYMEAQNNVKLFSFMLLIISSVELLNLLAIAMGVPQEESTNSFTPDQDDIFPPDPYDSNSGNNSSNIPSTDGMNITYQEWGVDTWVDLVINTAGVYVALLGLRATTHNTLKLARRYLYGLFLVGTSWLIFNYFISFEINEAVEEKREENDTDGSYPDETRQDIAFDTLSVMVLPCMVWCMCCLRAWQFQYLLREAEEEAEERMQRQMGLQDSPAEPNHDEELALQDENAIIS